MKKRKNISSTNSLPKFKSIFVLYAIIIYLITITQPIVNYALILKFNSEAITNMKIVCKIKINYNFLFLYKKKKAILYEIKSHFISNINTNYSIILKNFVPDEHFYNVEFYFRRANNLVN